MYRRPAPIPDDISHFSFGFACLQVSEPPMKFDARSTGSVASAYTLNRKNRGIVKLIVHRRSEPKNRISIIFVPAHHIQIPRIIHHLLDFLVFMVNDTPSLQPLHHLVGILRILRDFVDISPIHSHKSTSQGLFGVLKVTHFGFDNSEEVVLWTMNMSFFESGRAGRYDLLPSG